VRKRSKKNTGFGNVLKAVSNFGKGGRKKRLSHMIVGKPMKGKKGGFV
jgi:hypothetical protein